MLFCPLQDFLPNFSPQSVKPTTCNRITSNVQLFLLNRSASIRACSLPTRVIIMPDPEIISGSVCIWPVWRQNRGQPNRIANCWSWASASQIWCSARPKAVPIWRAKRSRRAVAFCTRNCSDSGRESLFSMANWSLRCSAARRSSISAGSRTAWTERIR